MNVLAKIFLGVNFEAYLPKQQNLASSKISSYAVYHQYQVYNQYIFLFSLCHKMNNVYIAIAVRSWL